MKAASVPCALALVSVLCLAPGCETTRSVNGGVKDQQYGETHFEASGSRAAHDAFLTGLLQLHNFEYMDARVSVVIDFETAGCRI